MNNSRSNLSLSEKDNKKIIFERIQNVENNFGDLCSELSKFTKKKAGLRDKYDELGRLFKVIADNDEFNETMSEGLINYSKAMVLIADIKDIEVQRLQTKLVRELANYDTNCKNVKEGAKHAIMLREKELSRKQQLEQIKQRSQKNRASDAGDAESSRNKSEQKKPGYEVEDIILKFEQQKLVDLRKLLIDFTLIQLKEHVKCVEILSAAYQDINEIDVEKDLQEFNDKFLMNDEKMLKNRLKSQSMGALSSLFNSSSEQSKPTKRNLSNSTYSLDTVDKGTSKNNGRDGNTRKNIKYESEQSDSTSATENEDDSISEDTDQSIDGGDGIEDDGNRKSRRKIGNEEDDEDVILANNGKTDKKRTARNDNSGIQSKSTAAPVPHVRFSRLLHQNAGN